MHVALTEAQRELRDTVRGNQWRLADMASAVEAARLLTLRAAFLKDRRLAYTKEAAVAKVYAAETAMTLATQAVQIHGGSGYTCEFAVEREAHP